MNVQTQINHELKVIQDKFISFKEECENKNIGSVDCKWDIKGKVPFKERYLPVRFSRVDDKEWEIELIVQGSTDIKIIEKGKGNVLTFSKIKTEPTATSQLVNITSLLLENVFSIVSFDPNLKLQEWKDLFNSSNTHWLHFKEWHFVDFNEINFIFDIVPFKDLSLDFKNSHLHSHKSLPPDLLWSICL